MIMAATVIIIMYLGAMTTIMGHFKSIELRHLKIVEELSINIK
jgi:hypothetical protein